jgi:hypothetical protein
MKVLLHWRAVAFCFDRANQFVQTGVGMIALTKVRARHYLRAALLDRSRRVGSLPSAHAQLAGWTLELTDETTRERAPRRRSARASRDTAHAYREFSHIPRAGHVFNLDVPAATYWLTVGSPFETLGMRVRGSALPLQSRRVEALREAWRCRIARERATGGWEDRP